MEHSFNWKPGDIQFITCMICIALGYMSYYFITKSGSLEKAFIKRFGEEASKVNWIVFQRLTGVLFFGLVPLIMIIFIIKVGLFQYGFSSGNFKSSLYWILILSPIVIILGFLNRKKPDNLAMYPQIRKKEWNIQLICLSALSWMAYLLAYEFMFRGFLLFASLQYVDTWPALSLNVAIYALVHVPKGYKEAFGAIPLGIVLVIASISTGNILVAFVVHSVMALSNEWMSLSVHPDMKFYKK
jgi:membrane protease YdiL (CAAX protease family)